jgi:hypothetical protein
MYNYKVIISFALISGLVVSACVSDVRDETTTATEDSELANEPPPVFLEAAATEDSELANEPPPASPEAASIAASCQIHIGVTSRSGNTISGFGSQENCGTMGVSQLTIQRSRFFGWEDLTTVNVVGSGHDVFVRYNCSGTGTHDFRTIHTGRTIGGTPLFKGSNIITATCN